MVSDLDTLADTVIALSRLTMKFGEIERITRHPDGKPFETDTTHTVMLTLVACALAHRYYHDLDVGLIAQLCAGHDVPEVYADDTATLRMLTAAELAEKDAREHAGFVRIVREFGAELPWIDQIIAQYRRQDTPEARFVRAVDWTLPKTTHLLNGGATVRAEQQTATQVRDRYEVQRQQLAAFAGDFPIVLELRDELVRRMLDMLTDTER